MAIGIVFVIAHAHLSLVRFSEVASTGIQLSRCNEQQLCHAIHTTIYRRVFQSGREGVFYAPKKSLIEVCCTKLKRMESGSGDTTQLYIVDLRRVQV